VVAKWDTVQNWKKMLNHLDAMCGDRIREAGVRHQEPLRDSPAGCRSTRLRRRLRPAP